MAYGARVSGRLPRYLRRRGYLSVMRTHLRFILILIATAVLGFGVSLAQSSWPTLARVRVTKEYGELLSLKVDKPVFSQVVKDLAGQGITPAPIFKRKSHA